MKYNLGFNLYDAKTKITKYNNETGLFGKDKNDKDTYRVGMELGEIWGYVTDRLYTVDDFDADGKLKAGIPKVEGYNPNPGDILYKDLDDNDIINGGTSTTKDPGDRKIIGNSTRRYQYGIHGGITGRRNAQTAISPVCMRKLPEILLPIHVFRPVICRMVPT